MRSAVLFGLVVSLCLAQIAWWIIFQFRETDRLENAVEMLAVGATTSGS